jgi:hypothetical protein
LTHCQRLEIKLARYCKNAGLQNKNRQILRTYLPPQLAARGRAVGIATGVAA